LWPYLRATCTSCGEANAVSYCYIEGKGDDISAECCDSCGTYIKHFRQDRQPRTEPLADDIASLDLDLMMRETRYVRRMSNPLLLFENSVHCSEMSLGRPPL
jgi:FdhE protein